MVTTARLSEVGHSWRCIQARTHCIACSACRVMNMFTRPYLINNKVAFLFCFSVFLYYTQSSTELLVHLLSGIAGQGEACALCLVVLTAPASTVATPPPPPLCSRGVGLPQYFPAIQYRKSQHAAPSSQRTQCCPSKLSTWRCFFYYLSHHLTLPCDCGYCPIFLFCTSMLSARFNTVPSASARKPLLVSHCAARKEWQSNQLLNMPAAFHMQLIRPAASN